MEKFGEERCEKLAPDPLTVCFPVCQQFFSFIFQQGVRENAWQQTEGSNVNVDVGDVLFYMLKLKKQKQKKRIQSTLKWKIIFFA